MPFVYMKYNYSQYLAGCIYTVDKPTYISMTNSGAAVGCKNPDIDVSKLTASTTTKESPIFAKP